MDKKFVTSEILKYLSGKTSEISKMYKPSLEVNDLGLNMDKLVDFTIQEDSINLLPPCKDLYEFSGIGRMTYIDKASKVPTPPKAVSFHGRAQMGERDDRESVWYIELDRITPAEPIIATEK